jgi:chemotaxis protein CheX
MAKRPKVSLASIVAETARQAGESSTEPQHSATSARLDEGAPMLDAYPRLVTPAAESMPPLAVATQSAAAAPASDPAPVAAPASELSAALTIEHAAGPDLAPVVDGAPVPVAETPVERGLGADVIELPPILDLKAAAKLLEEFTNSRGGALDIDASKVQRLGGLCLQVLLSAQRSWTVDGKPFRVVDPSADFVEGAKAFGAVTLIESAA